LATIKAVLFDLYGTLVHLEKPITDEEVSDYLFKREYEVSPQMFKAAWAFVSFIDYPKYGFRDWRPFLRRIFWRLEVKINEETLKAIAERFERNPYKLYPDAVSAVIRAKASGFRTAIVTTIAHFKFQNAVQPIREQFDFVMTGYEAGCDKTHPKMYKKTLEILNVKPNEAVMVGDDLATDVLLPRKQGIHAILLDRARTISDCSEAIAVVHDLDEAVETVIKGNRKN